MPSALTIPHLHGQKVTDGKNIAPEVSEVLDEPTGFDDDLAAVHCDRSALENSRIDADSQMTADFDVAAGVDRHGFRRSRVDRGRIEKTVNRRVAAGEQIDGSTARLLARRIQYGRRCNRDVG